MRKHTLLTILLSIAILCSTFISLVPEAVLAQDGENDPLDVDVSVSPETVVAGEPVTVQFDLTVDMGSVTCKTNVTRPLDIVLVVDTSGSMRDSLGMNFAGTKLDGAVDAVDTFLATMSDENDLAGLVGFSNSGKTYHELTMPSTVRNGLPEFKKAGEADGGGTDIADGINEAVDTLNQSARADTAHAIILLTDGDTGSQNEAIEAAATAKQADIRMITIGLGDDINESLMQTMASEPQDYYFVPETSELVGVYQAISNSLVIEDAVTSILVTYQFDRNLFDLVENSVYPEAEVAYDLIKWELPFMEDGNHQALKATLMPKSSGSSYAATNFDVEYHLCDQPDSFLENNENILPITVSSVSEVYCPVTDGRTASGVFSLCRIPWGWVIGLLALLLLLLFWYLKHRDTLQLWERMAKPIRRCTMWDIPWRVGLALFLGFFIAALTKNLCTPDYGGIFYREYPDRSSAIFMQPFSPDGKTEQITELRQEDAKLTYHVPGEFAQQIYTVSYENDTPHLLAYDLEGKPADFAEVQGTYPSISPDEQKMAYTSIAGDIMVLDLVSGSIEPLAGASDSEFIETMPTWSADGQNIAFVRAGSSNQAITITTPCDIMTVQSSGGVPVFVVGASGGGFNYSPVYSPDGQWLAYLQHTDGSSTYNDAHAEVRLVDTAGSGESILIAPAASNMNFNGGNTWLTWNPNGQSLMFSSMSCDGQYDIVQVGIDETGNPISRERVEFASDPGSYEFGLQWISINKPNLFAALLKTLPWLILAALLWAIRRFFICRKKKPEELEDTIITEVNVDKELGLLIPDERFKITVGLTGKPLCPPKIKEKKADVVMLLDTSGSMEGSPLQSAIAASKEFVKQVLPKNGKSIRRFAVIGFDDEMKEYQKLTDDRAKLLSAFSSVKTGGSTNMEDGLRAAIETLVNDGRAETKKVILLLTDGVPNDEDVSLRLAEEAKDQNIKIFAVGVGEADEELLQKMVGEDGKYQYVRNHRDQNALVEAFKTAAQDTLLPSPATNIKFEHHYHKDRFELIPGSIVPGPQEFDDEQGVIKWYLPELGENVRHFSYEVRPLIADIDADQPIDDYGEISYDRCGVIPKVMMISPSVNVRVYGWNTGEMKLPIDPLVLQDPDIIWEPDQALFIGIGGVGRLALTYIKKNLEDAGAGKLGEGVEFLVLDTDIYEKLGEEKVGFSIARTAIDQEDVFILDENLTSYIEENGNGNGEAVFDWFNIGQFRGDPHLNLSAGTFGNRLKARLALIRNLLKEKQLEKTSVWFKKQIDSKKSPFFRDWLETRCEKALRVDDDGKKKLRIYIVSSLAGGMSGTITDVSYLTRKLGRGIVGESGELQIEGYFLDGASFENVVPSEEVRRRCMANSFAAQREIERWQANPGYPYSLEWDLADDKGLTRPLFNAVTRFSRKAKLNGVSGLTSELCPEMADVITTRLDKAMQGDRAADWFDGIKYQADQRRLQEHIVTVGLPRMYSWRIPVADILHHLHGEWIEEFFMGVLNSSLDCESFDNATPEQVFSQNSLENPTFSDVGISDYVNNFFLGGGKIAFAGCAPSESRVLSNIVLPDELKFEALGCDSDRSIEQIQENFRNRLQVAVQYFLSGSKGSDHGQLGSRLALARTFIDTLRETLIGIQNDEHSDQFAIDISIYYLEILDELAVVNQINELEEVVYQQPEQSGKDGDDVIHQLIQYRKNLNNSRVELDKIESRKYFWDRISVTVTGQRKAESYKDIWRKRYLTNDNQDFHKYVSLEYDLETGIDLKLDIVSPVYLLRDGSDRFIDGLLKIAQMQTRNAWGETDIAAVLSADGVLNSAADDAKDWVDFQNWLTPAGGAAVSKKLYAIATDQSHRSIHTSVFYRDLMRISAMRDGLAIHSSSIQSTDRFSLGLLHDIEAVGLYQLQHHTQEQNVFLTVDGYNSVTNSYAGALVPRYVATAESNIHKLERNNVKTDTHPYISAALQNPMAAQEYFLVFALGMIVEHPKTHSLVFVQKKEGEKPEVVDLNIQPRNGISIFVDGLLAWTLGPDTVARSKFAEFLSQQSQAEISSLLKHSFAPAMGRVCGPNINLSDAKSFCDIAKVMVQEYLVRGVE